MLTMVEFDKAQADRDAFDYEFDLAAAQGKDIGPEARAGQKALFSAWVVIKKLLMQQPKGE